MALKGFFTDKSFGPRDISESDELKLRALGLDATAEAKKNLAELLKQQKAIAEGLAKARFEQIKEGKLKGGALSVVKQSASRFQKVSADLERFMRLEIANQESAEAAINMLGKTLGTLQVADQKANKEILERILLENRIERKQVANTTEKLSLLVRKSVGTVAHAQGDDDSEFSSPKNKRSKRKKDFQSKGRIHDMLFGHGDDIEEAGNFSKLFLSKIVGAPAAAVLNKTFGIDKKVSALAGSYKGIAQSAKENLIPAMQKGAKGLLFKALGVDPETVGPNGAVIDKIQPMKGNDNSNFARAAKNSGAAVTNTLYRALGIDPKTVGPAGEVAVAKSSGGLNLLSSRSKSIDAGDELINDTLNTKMDELIDTLTSWFRRSEIENRNENKEGGPLSMLKGLLGMGMGKGGGLLKAGGGLLRAGGGMLARGAMGLLSSPVAAIAGAGMAGWGIGSKIYEKFGDKMAPVTDAIFGGIESIASSISEFFTSKVKFVKDFFSSDNKSEFIKEQLSALASELGKWLGDKLAFFKKIKDQGFIKAVTSLWSDDEMDAATSSAKDGGGAFNVSRPSNINDISTVASAPFNSVMKSKSMGTVSKSGPRSPYIVTVPQAQAPANVPMQKPQRQGTSMDDVDTVVTDTGLILTTGKGLYTSGF